jgi:hypothetical protein
VNPELAARRTAASAVLADFRSTTAAEALVNGPSVRWSSLAGRLASVLDMVQEVADSPAAAPEPEPGKLGAIRAVLDAFDWEHYDRQYALERIEQIADGSRTASGAEPGGGAYVTPADLQTLGQA